MKIKAKKNITMKRMITALLVMTVALSGLAMTTQISNAATKVTVGTVSSVKVKTVGKDKLKVYWSKSGKITGFKVYQSTGGKYKLVKTTKGKSYTTRNLKKNKTYKYVVKPYYKKSGKTYNGKTSYNVTARTYRSTKNNVSNIKITTYASSMTVGNGKTFKAKLYGSKLMSTSVRWSSSNSAVASVSSKGYVTAKKTGSAYIYAKSHNGLTVKIKVTVKAKPAATTPNNVGSTATHSHSWTPVYETKSYFYPTYEERTYCKVCGEDITNNIVNHMNNSPLNCQGVVNKWIATSTTKSNSVLVGYKCSCGATTHAHYYKPIYIESSEQYQSYEAREICNDCGMDITDLDITPAAHSLNHFTTDPNALGSWRTEYRYITRTKPVAVLQGYEKCSCGATK